MGAAAIILQRLADAGFAVVPALPATVTEDELAKFIYEIADHTASTAPAARTARAILQRFKIVEGEVMTKGKRHNLAIPGDSPL